MKQRLIIAISFIMTGIVINILFKSNTIIHKFIAILGLSMYYRGVFREYKKFKNNSDFDLILYITGLNPFCFMRTNYLNRNTTLKTANYA